ncbi:hypothetical protein Ade02nite_96910 [Paractinoplanes deccanensis]|uniref:Uncharacterized protein n=1 Tax=Paractinoplanes deccanensis TaxID=113561 RepID=A0ABQ3YM07_9ACTN|nr:hypothetical protein Ade02nite_96910 [Actinoplanes deccanensis]
MHDFDEIGVPAGANTAWRQRSTEEWIQRVLRYQAEGLDVLLTGQSPLGEVLASPSATALDGIAACLLDVADRVRRHRLDNRDPGKWDADAKRSFLGWARWHRGHAVDPRHQPEVITAAGWQSMRWSRWNTWSATDRRWTVRIIDTTERSVEQTAADVGQWIAGARVDFAGGQLSLAAGTWTTAS